MSRKGRVGWKELEVAAGWESFSSKGERPAGEMKTSSRVEERSTVHDSALRLHISYFPHRCDEILDKRQLNVRKVNLRRTMLHHGVEGRVAGAWGRWPHCIFSQKAQQWIQVLGLPPPFYGVFQARTQVLPLWGAQLVNPSLLRWLRRVTLWNGGQSEFTSGVLNFPFCFNFVCMYITRWVCVNVCVSVCSCVCLEVG